MPGQKTPLYDIHVKYGGKIVEFGDWLLPVQYSGILEEHKAVRERAGLFDVSHMGEIIVEGPDAFKFLQYMLVNDMEGLVPGRVRYSPVCYEDGGTVDDVLVYMLDTRRYLLVVNAANTDKDFMWFNQHSAAFDCRVENISNQISQIALQGPFSVNILTGLVSDNPAEMRYYAFREKVLLAGRQVLLSRTGYTGEDGFEIYASPGDAALIWEAVMERGKGYGLLPAGLGARDILRLEAGMPLYGHELSKDISPLEAGLASFVKLDKTRFIGQDSLRAQDREGTGRRLTGVVMVERGIPRHGYVVRARDREIGYITSGTYSPSLEKNIGLALVEKEFAAPGQEVYIDIRGKNIKAETTGAPFYKRRKKP